MNRRGSSAWSAALSAVQLSLVLSSVLLCAQAGAEVDPDCFAGEDSFTCAGGRVEDAKAADELFTPIIETAGWRRQCFSVQYIAGDAGKPDALSVVLYGAAGDSPPTCRIPTESGKATAATNAVLKRIAALLKDALKKSPPPVRTRLLRHVDVLSLGNGYGSHADVALP